MISLLQVRLENQSNGKFPLTTSQLSSRECGHLPVGKIFENHPYNIHMCSNITNNITLAKYKLHFTVCVATQDLDKLMRKSELPPRSCLHAQIIHSHVVPYHCTVMGAPGSADRDHLPLALLLGLLAGDST